MESARNGYMGDFGYFILHDGTDVRMRDGAWWYAISHWRGSAFSERSTIRQVDYLLMTSCGDIQESFGIGRPLMARVVGMVSEDGEGAVDLLSENCTG